MIRERTDVLIVGGGPTGLLLAGDLARAGVAVTLVEKHAEGSNLTRAFGVHARTLEQLDARGLADELCTTGARIDGVQLFGRVHIDLARWIDGRFPYLLITPQYHVERLLHARAAELGADLVHGAELVSLRQGANGVDADVRQGDSTTTVHAAYVVGADGFRSRVRDQLGLPFPGKSVLASLMLADVRLRAAPEQYLAVNAVGDCFAFVAPFGDGWYRIFAWNRRNPLPDSAPVDFDELRAVTRKALGTDYGMHDPRWLSRFHSDERQVPQYRAGRVFLAGDAAHVHSPAGGQGMNTGLQDAANLGWKLAAAVQGWAPDGLLDTYHAERYPVGREVLASSGAIIRAAMIRPVVGRTARNTLGAIAMRIPPIARRAAGSVSGIGFRYPRPAGAHPLVGTKAIDVVLPDGKRLYETLRDGRFAVVPGRPALVVRPDGYVAWAGAAADAQVALREWRQAPGRTNPVS